MNRIKDHLEDAKDPNVKFALEMTMDATKRLHLFDGISILTIPEKVLHNDNLLEEFCDIINNIVSIDRIYISEYCFPVLWMFINKGWTYGSPSKNCAIKAQEENWPANYKMILICKN